MRVFPDARKRWQVVLSEDLRCGGNRTRPGSRPLRSGRCIALARVRWLNEGRTAVAVALQKLRSFVPSRGDGFRAARARPSLWLVEQDCCLDFLMRISGLHAGGVRFGCMCDCT
jgi:hypothetical protein